MNKYIKNCTGCGLCHAIVGMTMQQDKNGFLRPCKIQKEEEFLKDICLLNGKNVKKTHNFWGDFRSVYCGFSNNKEIRYSASSGGILTSLCVFLIENHMVDGIIQTCVDDKDPIRTRIMVSETAEDVLKCKGSRYAHSAPFYNIDELVNVSKTYAFVGKPCDIIILKNYQKKYKKLENIKITLSFFCAGTPSRKANLEQIERLGVDSQDIASVHYRGNGWPGKYTIRKKNGEVIEQDYIDAWNSCLGRQVQDICRFCFDGIGEASDISCGDYWYTSDEGKPAFKETEGLNVILSWTEQGDEILKKANLEDKISLEVINDLSRLDKCQPHHLNRRSTMAVCTIAMRIFCKPSPKYSLKLLFKYHNKVSNKIQYSYFKGIVSRILKKRI